MAEKVRLDPTWWKKHAPESLRKGAIEKALKDFSKCSDSLKKSSNARSYFKAVSTLKSAVAT